MEEIDVLALQNALRRSGVLISFSGRFSQAVIEELGDAVKRYLETEMTSQSETYNVFSVFIEQTQNIKNYGEREHAANLREKIRDSGIVLIGKTEQEYFVSSGNLIENADTAALETVLQRLEGLDKAELKKLYRSELKKELPPGSESAGIGLIDMARRAGRPIQYKIERLDGDLAFFTLKVYV